MEIGIDEVGEGILEASNQENYNNIDNSIFESDGDEQLTEDKQESQEEATQQKCLPRIMQQHLVGLVDP